MEKERWRAVRNFFLQVTTLVPVLHFTEQRILCSLFFFLFSPGHQGRHSQSRLCLLLTYSLHIEGDCSQPTKASAVCMVQRDLLGDIYFPQNGRSQQFNSPPALAFSQVQELFSAPMFLPEGLLREAEGLRHLHNKMVEKHK